MDNMIIKKKEYKLVENRDPRAGGEFCKEYYDAYYCPFCTSFVPEDSRFCCQCGKKLVPWKATTSVKYTKSKRNI